MYVKRILQKYVRILNGNIQTVKNDSKSLLLIGL